MLFTGEYEHTLDHRNRLSIPARFRQALSPDTIGEKFYLVLGEDKRLCLYPDKYYEQLVNRHPADLIPDKTMLSFYRLTFGLARLVELDNSGRVVIPENMIRRASLGRQVSIIGVRDHLEIWNSEEWEQHVENGLSEYSETLDRARLARMQPGPGTAPETK